MNERSHLLRGAADRLAGAGVVSPRVDAEHMLAHLLGVPRARLLLGDDLPALICEQYEELVRRRAGREPLQHLLGTAAFRYIEVAVGPGVFVPRPETELLVDAVLPLVGGIAEPLVVDLCAGSGALALAVADEVPGARVVAVERSPGALVWLHRNVDALDRANRVTVVAADVARPEDALIELYGRVDAVVSNPPYVPSTTPVGSEVAHDPAEAVFAGADGLDLIPAVIDLGARLLRAGGAFAMEHDLSQHDSVPALFDARRWSEIVDHCDLAGRPRYVTCTRTDS